jgi:hypothetical protein
VTRAGDEGGSRGWSSRGWLIRGRRPMGAVRWGRPTTRGAWASAAWLVVVAVAAATGRATVVPLVVGLAVPLAAAPVISCRRMRRVPDRLSLHLRAGPPMVPLGATCRLHLTVAGTTGSLPPLGLESPDGRWRSLDGLPGLDGRSTGDGWDAPRPLGRWAPRGADLVRFPPTPAGTTSVIERPVPTLTRGILGLPRLRLWVGDPLGLFAWAGPVQASTAIVVHPSPAGLDTLDPATVGAPGIDGTAEGQPASRVWDGPGDLAGLRPYRAGDRLRLVHWPSLGGPGDILVREFAPDSDQVVQIVVDDRVGTHHRHAFDDALAVTYALIARSNAEGHATDLLTLSGYRARIAPSAAGMAGLLPMLATLNPRRTGDAPSGAAAGAAGGPAPGWVRWDATWQFGRCTVVTTETAARSLPAAVTALGRIVTV